MTRVLNGGVASSAGAGARRKPDELSSELQKSMLRMKGEFMDAEGKGVDYDALRKSALFSDYVKLSRELVECDMKGLGGEERKAFFINVYNALTIHGLLEAEQVPSSVLQVNRFWQDTAYNIGGLVYSLDDIEHGVLRGNRPHPSCAEPPFSDSDPRKQFSLSLCDPRIHFALVCGAQSCPAIQVYSANNLDRALNAAATSFCSQEVELEEGRGRVRISKIFQWYGGDFGSSETEILKWVCQFLPDEKRRVLQQLLSNDSSQIEAKEYNWLLNRL